MTAESQQMTLAMLEAIPEKTRATVTLTGQFMPVHRLRASGETISRSLEFFPDCLRGYLLHSIPLTALSLEEGSTTSVTLLQPPVDPDLVLAREIVAEAECEWPAYTKAVLSGTEDGERHVRIALAAIRAANARSKA